ncbi:MAG: hypothetical protein V9G19_10325 [Tetrasphaera sp.]
MARHAYFTVIPDAHQDPQFQDGAALPGLDQARAAIPSGWGSSRLARFMSTPDENLGGLNPVAWLSAKDDPSAVAQLLADESRE